jgi:uncharacterized RDD family membrane protein YckC
MDPSPVQNPYAPPASGAEQASMPLPADRPQELASCSSRLIAHIIDHAVVFGPSITLAAIYGAVSYGGDNRAYAPLVTGAFWVLVVAGAIAQLLVQDRLGQSLGKRLMAIRVVRLDGAPPSMLTIVFGRNLSTMVMGSVAFGLAALVDALMIFGDERRCLHDRIAGTRVVRVR